MKFQCEKKIGGFLIETLFCSGWMVVIPSLGIEYSGGRNFILSLFINLSDKKYFRYLKKKRRWNNQNEEFHTAILSGLLVKFVPMGHCSAKEQ